MLIQPVLRPVLQPVLRSIFDPGIGGGGTPIWTPAALFAASEQGGWYDPSDLSTMFQDAAGTVPVTAEGQSVGRILDKSGNGNHATQANASNKPILQSIGGKLALVFDGVDDFLSIGIIDFTSTDKMTVVAGVTKLSDAAIGSIVELDVGANGLNAFHMQWPLPGTSVGFSSGGSIQISVTASWLASPASAVLTGVGDISGNLAHLRGNGVQLGQNTGDQGTGAYGKKPLFIGRRNGSIQSFNGHIYQLIVRGALTADLAPIETFTADKIGITL